MSRTHTKVCILAAVAEGAPQLCVGRAGGIDGKGTCKCDPYRRINRLAGGQTQRYVWAQMHGWSTWLMGNVTQARQAGQSAGGRAKHGSSASLPYWPHTRSNYDTLADFVISPRAGISLNPAKRAKCSNEGAGGQTNKRSIT